MVLSVPEGAKEHWLQLFSRLSPLSQFQGVEPGDINILGPVSLAEIEWLKGTISISTSSGPDAIKAEEIKNANSEDLRRIYNSLLRIKDIHVSWAKGFTVLIPKIDNPRTPSDFRPITIMSVLTRGLHKILAKRISRNMPIDIRQKGFKEEEGVGANIMILKDIIKQAKEQPQTTYLCFIDFSKAFASISHWALLDGLAVAGLDHDSITYIKNYYLKAATNIMGEDTQINRRVLQDDPMSPVIFNIILQFALRRIPEAVGVVVRGTCIKYLAFADDVVVVASSRPGIEIAVNTLLSEAAKIGLQPGIQKCGLLGFIADKKRKTWMHNHRPLPCGDQEIPVIDEHNSYKYLGIEVGPLNRNAGGNTWSKLNKFFNFLTMAPLKPQQRI